MICTMSVVRGHFQTEVHVQLDDQVGRYTFNDKEITETMTSLSTTNILWVYMHLAGKRFAEGPTHVISPTNKEAL